MIRAGVLLLALWGLQAQAAEPRRDPVPEDFRLQRSLTVSGDNGVVRVELPASVYQHARSPGLADVRVFDARGRAVPFTFVEPRASTATEWDEREARLFPVKSPMLDAMGELDLEVRADAAGAVVSVKSRPRRTGSIDDEEEHEGHEHRQRQSQRGAMPSVLAALVLDLGAAPSDETLDSLQFFLPADTSSYRAELAIEQSDDLKLWSRVAQSRVDWLSGAQQADRLINDRIAVAARSGRYLRIEWLEGEPLLFARVLARWRTTRAAAEPQLHLTVEPSPGRMAGDWLYVVGPAIEVQEMGLQLPLANTVLPVTFGAYRWLPSRRQWQFEPFAENTFYRITQGGVERTSGRMRIAPMALAEWVVRPQDPNAAAPNLEVSFKPRTLIFTAQRAREFILAYGAEPRQLAAWTTSAAPLSRVAPGFSASDLQRLERAMLGEPETTSAGELRDTESAAKTKSDSPRLILWLVLIAGVLLLAAMTWRLAKQMQSMRRDEPTDKQD
jgi:hypothetical protein